MNNDPINGNTGEPIGAAAHEAALPAPAVPRHDRRRRVPVAAYVTVASITAAGSAWLAGLALEGWSRRLALVARLVLIVGIPVMAGLAGHPFRKRGVRRGGARR